MTGRHSPSFQFYPRDWLASSSVRRMTLAERGAYIDLLAYAWQDGGLPDDDAEIARLLQVSLRVWRTLAPRVRSRFQVQDGQLINARLEGVRAEQAAYRERRANAGRSGAAKRWRNSGPDDGTATTEPRIEDSPAIDLPSSLPSSRHGPAIDLPMAKHSSASASASASERSQIRTGGVLRRTEDGAPTGISPPAADALTTRAGAFCTRYRSTFYPEIQGVAYTPQQRVEVSDLESAMRLAMAYTDEQMDAMARFFLAIPEDRDRMFKNAKRTITMLLNMAEPIAKKLWGTHAASA